MLIEIIAAVIGVMLIAGGAYYLATEKHDGDSKKIYTITVLIGILITAGALFRIFMS